MNTAAYAVMAARIDGKDPLKKKQNKIIQSCKQTYIFWNNYDGNPIHQMVCELLLTPDFRTYGQTYNSKSICLPQCMGTKRQQILKHFTWFETAQLNHCTQSGLTFNSKWIFKATTFQYSRSLNTDHILCSCYCDCQTLCPYYHHLQSIIISNSSRYNNKIIRQQQ